MELEAGTRPRSANANVENERNAIKPVETEERREREDEIERDTREKQDEIVRSILITMIESYNQVKRVRRLLAAKTHDVRGGHVTLTLYDEYMAILIDEQLAFEQLKRVARTVPQLRAVKLETPPNSTEQPARLAAAFSQIEKYLNFVIKEYKANRDKVSKADPDGVPLRELRKLSRFLGGRSFIASVSTPVRKIQKALQLKFLEPLPSTPPSEPPQSDAAGGIPTA